MESLLFTPLKLGPLNLVNRIAVSPMCQYSATDGCAGEWHLQHITNLGFSGAGSVMVESTAVSKEGRITLGCLGLYSDQNEKALTHILATARKFSPKTVFGIQLSHAGRKASSQLPWEGGKCLNLEDGGWTPVSPSAIRAQENAITPKELSESELNEIINSFVSAAKRAVRAGFEIIEIHSAHGYLLHQFLSAVSNYRSDQYGGNLLNRMKFPLKIIEAVRKAIPSYVALGSRITGTDWVMGGITVDEAIVYATELKKRGVDYVCVSSGGLAPKAQIPVGHGYQVSLAASVKQGADITTRAVGMISDARQAEDIIVHGQADFVAIARAFLDDPRWAWHAADELGAEVFSPPQYDWARPPRWNSPLVNKSVEMLV